MARHLPAHLSYKSALALLAPPGITAPIESVRRVHDRHFARWPPHINLLYPFLASPSEAVEDEQGDSAGRLKDDIQARIQKAVAPMKAFSISLHADSANHFSHSSRSKSIWLGPSTQCVQELQAALQAEFAECNAAHVTKFTPHLTVGQAKSDAKAEELKGEMKRNVTDFAGNKEGTPASLDWYVDKVYVIERKGFHDRFKVVGSIDLRTWS